MLISLASPALALDGAGPAKPQVYSRASWGAPECKGSKDEEKQRIVVHHTDNPVTEEELALRGVESWEAAAERARKIRKDHMTRNGWSDIGYHYLVDWRGRVFEGRPVDQRGAHVRGNNRGSIGIVLMGDFTQGEAPKEQVIALFRLTAWLLEEYGIPPKEIYGHGDFNNTACPGHCFYDKEDTKSAMILVRESHIAHEKLGEKKAPKKIPLLSPATAVLPSREYFPGAPVR